MSSDYYSLEKAAEVLGLPTAEVNRLREKSQLRAFRDGASWKFRKVDVDNFLAETIKNRGKKKDEVAASDSDFDLLSMDDDAEETPTLLADSSSFDALMEDGLALEDNMIDAAPGISSAKPIESHDSLDDDLILMDDDDGLSLIDESSDSASPSPAASKSDVDLAIDGDDLVLDDHGSSAQLNLAGDSGLSLLEIADDVELQPAEKGGSDAILELADDDDILSLVDDDMPSEQTSTIAIPVEDDFQLTPDAGSMISDDSESASQVIALEEDNMFGAPIESPFGAAPAMETPMPGAPGGGFGVAASPFTATSPGEFISSGPAYAAPTSAEATYSPGLVAFIVIVTVFLAVPGIMMLDLIIHIWSWGEPFIINSAIMDMICDMFGLR